MIIVGLYSEDEVDDVIIENEERYKNFGVKFVKQLYKKNKTPTYEKTVR